MNFNEYWSEFSIYCIVMSHNDSYDILVIA